MPGTNRSRGFAPAWLCCRVVGLCADLEPPVESAFADLLDARKTFALKSLISHAKRFVNDKDFRIDMDGNRKSQAGRLVLSSTESGPTRRTIEHGPWPIDRIAAVKRLLET